jgi:hypothetical protein
MTSIHDFAQQAHTRVPQYRGCSPEQALTYACEDVVIEVLGAPTMTVDHISSWMEQVCEIEDIDMPVVLSLSGRSRVSGSADIDSNVVCLQGRSPSTAVALHELAHVVSRSPDHTRDFRTCLVGLWRRHLSVEHAAMLHSLYVSTELASDCWEVQ